MAKNTDSNVTDLEDTVTAAAPATAVATDAAVDRSLDQSLVAHGFSGKRRKIILAPGEGEAGQLEQFFAINGFGIVIKRNEKVDVPAEFVDAIQNMVVGVVNADGSLGGARPRFNIQVLS